jgi:2-C-methyl-D-erythritol 4-phosphate cytidylyltransferase
MKIAVIIPAAGKSIRYGERDKLTEDIGGRPLLIRTVEFFAKREETAQMIVVGPPDDFEAFKERFGPSLSFHGVMIVQGGSTRSDSVRNALEHIDAHVDRIAVHDAARPALSNALFDKLLLASRQLDAVAPALPIAGTIKRTGRDKKSIVDEEDIADSIFGDSSRFTVDVFQVEKTIDRTGLWELQTPQIFSVPLLKQAYAQRETLSVTDDAELVELLGEVVHLLHGESRNIKVTTKDDLFLIKAMLNMKEPTQRSPQQRF